MVHHKVNIKFGRIIIFIVPCPVYGVPFESI